MYFAYGSYTIQFWHYLCAEQQMGLICYFPNLHRKGVLGCWKSKFPSTFHYVFCCPHFSPSSAWLIQSIRSSPSLPVYFSTCTLCGAFKFYGLLIFLSGRNVKVVGEMMTAMQLWRQCCEKCVCLQGDYVEKWLHFQLPRMSNFFLNKLGDLRTRMHHVLFTEDGGCMFP